jgi:hypothetical protein
MKASKSPPLNSDFYDTPVADSGLNLGCKHITTTYGNDFL